MCTQGSTHAGQDGKASRDEHDLADVAPLREHVLGGAGFLEAEGAGDDRLDRAVVEQLAQRLEPGSIVPRSFNKVSMFRPITAFDSDICLTSEKRGMRAKVRRAVGRLRLAPETTAEAPKPTSRPPGRRRL